MKNNSVQAEIINIGDEILAGHTLNSNAQWMSHALAGLSIPVVRHTVVADRPEDIRDALDQLRRATSHVFITGGLGPTEDDRTKAVLCDYFDDELEFHPEIWEELKTLFKKRGIVLADINKDQAILPVRARIIPNPVGSARGMVFTKNNILFYVMPGVPSEMKGIMSQYILPELDKLNRDRLYEYELHTLGMPESQIAQLIQDSCPQDHSIQLGYYPSYYGVTVRMKHSDIEILKNFRTAVRTCLGKAITYEGAQSLEEYILQIMKDGKKTLALAESCTGGLIGNMLTDIPGASQVLMQGFIVYSNQAKMQQLAVAKQVLDQHGAVSEETVIAMAQNACRIAGTDYALAVSGIAGPGGGTEEKPVGTVWLAVSDGRETVTRKLTRNMGRIRNKDIAAHQGLHLLREFIQN